MCVAMVIIHTKTLEKKAVDDVTSTASLQPHEPPAMSQALFPCGIMESGRWPEVGGGGMGSSLESLWDGVCETGAAASISGSATGISGSATGISGSATGISGSATGISGLLRDLSLSEAPAPAAPPSKRQCRSLSCSDGLGWRCPWRPLGSVWTAVEKRRCHSGGSVQRTAFAPAGFPAMQRSSSFSLPTHTESFSCPSHTHTHTLSLSHEPDPERHRLSRSRSQPCVHNHRKSGVKRRRPADTHTQRPSLDLLKMTQKLQDFHSVSCPGFTGDGQTLPSSIPSDATPDSALHQSERSAVHQSERSWPAVKERECLWAGLCSRRGRDVFQLGGELDIEQIERN